MRKVVVLLCVVAVMVLGWCGVAGAVDPTPESGDLGIITSPNITATTVGPRQVDLIWEPSQGEITGYEIIRSKPDAPSLFSALGSVPASVYSYTDTTVSPGTEYYYAVTPIYLQSQSRRIDYKKILVATPTETTPSNSTSSSSTVNPTTLTEPEQIKPTSTQTDTKSNAQIKVTTLKIGSTQMSVQDKNIVLDVAPKIENGRTLVPLRAISEALGAEVIWDEKNQTVTIIKRQGD